MFLIAFLISMPFVVALGMNNNGNHSDRIYDFNEKLHLYLMTLLRNSVNGRETTNESAEVAVAIAELSPTVKEQPDHLSTDLLDSIVNGFGELSTSDNEFKYKYCKFF